MTTLPDQALERTPGSCYRLPRAFVFICHPPARRSAWIRHRAHTMSLRLCIVLALAASALVSCRHHYDIARVSREIVLTREHPSHPDFRLRLLSIAQDGRTVVEFPAFDTTATYEAMPGEPFHSDTSGQRDVQLVSASLEKGEARLRVFYCVPR